MEESQREVERVKRELQADLRKMEVSTRLIWLTDFMSAARGEGKDHG